ncbi:MAG: hypothetical protein PHF74_07850 [Dehalococcoidales bacterium]|nr:hypothetical protein [Dehalococcoidales bacterium]
MRKVLLVLAGVLLLVVSVFSGCKGNVIETVVSTQTVVSNQTITLTSTSTSTPPAVTLPVITETITTTLPAETITVTGAGTTITSTNTRTTTTTVTASPSIITNTVDGTVVFTYSGKGEMNTLPFTLLKSPWVFQYVTDWSGDFTAYLIYDEGVGYGAIVSVSVTAWETYQTYVYNKTGENMYVKIEDVPSDGSWTIRVIRIT